MPSVGRHPSLGNILLRRPAPIPGLRPGLRAMQPFRLQTPGLGSSLHGQIPTLGTFQLKPPAPFKPPGTPRTGPMLGQRPSLGSPQLTPPPPIPGLHPGLRAMQPFRLQTPGLGGSLHRQIPTLGTFQLKQPAPLTGRRPTARRRVGPVPGQPPTLGSFGLTPPAPIRSLRPGLQAMQPFRLHTRRFRPDESGRTGPGPATVSSPTTTRISVNRGYLAGSAEASGPGLVGVLGNLVFKPGKRAPNVAVVYEGRSFDVDLTAENCVPVYENATKAKELLMSMGRHNEAQDQEMFLTQLRFGCRELGFEVE